MEKLVAMISPCLTLLLWGWFNNLYGTIQWNAFIFNGTIACIDQYNAKWKINVLHMYVTSTSKKWNIFFWSWSVYFFHVLDYLHVVGFSLTSSLLSMVLKVWVQFIDVPRSEFSHYFFINLILAVLAFIFKLLAGKVS